VYLLTSVGCFLHFVHLRICPLGMAIDLSCSFETLSMLCDSIRQYQEYAATVVLIEGYGLASSSW